MRVKSVTTKQNKGAEIFYVVISENPEENTAEFDPTDLVLFETAGEKSIYLRHPYVSKKYSVVYEESPLLDEAQKNWNDVTITFERIHPTSVVLTDDKGVIQQFAGNGVYLHLPEDCERKKLGVPTGTHYELCDGNHLNENHAESKGCRLLKEKGGSATQAYLYGHWWCCEPCSSAMEDIGVKKVHLSQSWTRKFLEL